jgi:hypothetical protein
MSSLIAHPMLTGHSSQASRIQPVTTTTKGSDATLFLLIKAYEFIDLSQRALAARPAAMSALTRQRFNASIPM